MSTTSKSNFESYTAVCTSDVACCQEAKVLAGAVEEVSATIKEQGWKPAMNPAVWTGAGTPKKANKFV